MLDTSGSINLVPGHIAALKVITDSGFTVTRLLETELVQPVVWVSVTE